MTVKVIVNAKLHEDLAATGIAPKAWAKSVTGINLSANGGAALLGEFIGPKRRMSVSGKDRNGHPYRYEWSLDLSSKAYNRSIILVALGIEYNNTKYYAPIVLFSKDIYKLALQESNVLDTLVDAPRNSATQLNYNPKIVVNNTTLASVTFAVTGGQFVVADKFSRVGRQNELYDAAKFIALYLLTSKKVKDRIRAVSTLPTAATEEDDLVFPSVSPSPEIPPKIETHHNRGESPVKQKPHKFQVHPHITKKMLGTPYGKNIKLPGNVWFMSDADGVALLLKDGKPRLMHILADYPDEISDELAQFLKEQAKVLAQISAAYLLVAGMKDQKKDLEPPPS